MAPKVREDYRDARRAQILDAAAECFLKKGFHRTTMQDIFEASGLSAGAVYNYFEGKDEIVAAMGDVSQARNTAMIARASGLEGQTPLTAILESFFEMLKTPEAGRWAPFDLETFAEASRNEDIRKSIRDNARATTGALVPLVEQLQASGVYSPDLDPQSVMYVFTMLLEGMQFLRVIDPEADLDAYAEACLAVARGTFRTAGTTDSNSKEA
jgi:AcrR family transcriptional regulator